jgi:RNA polymerase sigma factor (sigma-70 family)
LHRALAGLPYKQRGAVVYRYLADLPYAEVAALLECSESAARRNASDGIARLRRQYQKDST